MNNTELRTAVLEALAEAVPGIELDDLVSAESFREQLDIDSVDFLNFSAALSRRLGIDIPDADTPRLASLDDTVEYLAARRLGDR